MDEVNANGNQVQFDRVRRRLEALDKIEAKLRQMRELAVYAASRTLSETEAEQVQEWVDILKAEVQALDQATALEPTVPANHSVCQMEAKKFIQ